MDPETYETNSDQELLDNELFDLYRPTDNWLSPEECIPGHLYYGGSRSISQLAICRGVNEAFKATAFEGMRNKFGDDFLFSEFHWDEGGALGTYVPFVDLGEAPTFETEEETMWWLHHQLVEFVETRIDWLRAMPDRLKTSRSYPLLLRDNLENLEILKLVSVEGFSAHPALTFRQIMEQRKLKADQP